MSVESLTSLLTGGISAMAVMAIFLTLMLTGKLHTEGEFGRLASALDREKLAHDETRRALAEASARGDTATHLTELVVDALSRAGGGGTHVVPKA